MGLLTAIFVMGSCAITYGAFGWVAGESQKKEKPTEMRRSITLMIVSGLTNLSLLAAFDAASYEGYWVIFATMFAGYAIFCVIDILAEPIEDLGQ